MRVRATSGPGDAAAKAYAALYPHSGVHAAQVLMDRLDMCPPDAAHTGPDGEALLVVPLVLDVAAEFAGALGVMGACAPFGPAAYSAVSMDSVRRFTSHGNWYGQYAQDSPPDTFNVDDIETLDVYESESDDSISIGKV